MVRTIEVKREYHIGLTPPTDKFGKEDVGAAFNLLKFLYREGLTSFLTPTEQELANFLNSPKHRNLGSVYDIQAIFGVMNEVIEALKLPTEQGEEKIVAYFQEKGLDPAILIERVKKLYDLNKNIRGVDLLLLAGVNQENQVELSELGKRVKNGKEKLSVAQQIGIACHVVEELLTPAIS